MQSQQPAHSGDKAQTDPEYVFDISEQQDPQGQKDPCFCIKIQITKEMRAKMFLIEKQKKQKLLKLQQKQKLPQMVALRQRYDSYKKMDPKTFEEEKRKNQYNNEFYKAIIQYKKFVYHKEKYMFSLFQPFQNRGKCPYIKFNYIFSQKCIVIRINKHYFLNQLHLSRRDLFNVAITFNRTWEIDYYGMIRVLWKIYTQSQNFFYTIIIRSIDLISIIFDVEYEDKKSYRFRYSPFQFRNYPIFKDDIFTVTGYNQNLSCITEGNIIQKAVGPSFDSEFYNAPRLFIFDDLTDNNIFSKILSRTNLFYQMYLISRGIHPAILDYDEFSKKCLGNFYFSTTRLKKFIFTWSFKKPIKSARERRSKEEERERQVALQISFQPDRDPQPPSEPAYRMRMQVLQMTKGIALAIKEQIATKIKQWYLSIKQILCHKQKAFLQAEKQSLNRAFRSQKEMSRGQMQDFEIYLQFNSKDKYQKFFIGLILLVSTGLDRNYFSLDDKERRREDKNINLQTQQFNFFSNRKQYIHHIHSLKLAFKHVYSPIISFNNSREDDRNNFATYLSSRYSDYRLKFGEWKLDKIWKVKRQINIKTPNTKDQPIEPQQMELITFQQDFKKYISILLKHFPLRLIYKEILQFAQSIRKTCYLPPQEANNIKLNGYELVVSVILNVLLNQYYYCQFKEKEEKRDRDRDERLNQGRSQQRPNEPDYLKKEKMEESFSRVLILKVLTRGDVGFIPDEKLLFELTFKVLQFKTNWQTRIRQGQYIWRIFEDRIEYEKDYNSSLLMKLDIKGKKPTQQQSIRACIQNCFIDSKVIITI